MMRDGNEETDEGRRADGDEEMDGSSRDDLGGTNADTVPAANDHDTEESKLEEKEESAGRREYTPQDNDALDSEGDGDKKPPAVDGNVAERTRRNADDASTTRESDVHPGRVGDKGKEPEGEVAHSSAAAAVDKGKELEGAAVQSSAAAAAAAAVDKGKEVEGAAVQSSAAAAAIAGHDEQPNDREAAERIPPDLEGERAVATGSGEGHRGENALILATNEGGDNTPDEFHRQSRPGAFPVPVPVTVHRMPPPSSVARDDHDHDLEAHEAFEAHVAPSDEELAARQEAQQRAREERRLSSFDEQIRERLSRNAPLVEATIAQDVEDGGGGGSSVGVVAAPPSSASSSSFPTSSPQEGARRMSTKSALCMKRPRTMVLLAIGLLIAAATTTIVVVTLKDDDSPSAATALPPSNPPTAIPSQSPSNLISAAPSSRNTAQSSVDPDILHMAGILTSVSSTESLMDPLSPQHRACSWLVHDDTMNLTVDDVHDEERLIQRYIAATLLFSSGNTSDSSLDDIMLGHECDWNRPPTGFSWATPGGISCAEDGNISTISFGSHFRSLAGTFPQELGYLPHLQHLVMYVNPDLAGTPPDSLAALRELKRIVLLENRGLGGTIPSFASSCLREIIVGGCPFHGTIPSSIGNLTELVSLAVSVADLTGTVPDFIADMKDLAVLMMGGNRLTGSLPPSLGHGQDKLITVSFGSNLLNGTIPSGLLERKNLRGLFLDNNHLSGTISSKFGNMADLKALFLQSNYLTSTIPPELGNSTSLELLELGDNNFHGTVPSSLGSLVNLDSLSLADNPGLTGDINFFCNMSIPNFYTDCSLGNPNLLCHCCQCCHEISPYTCGQHSDGRTFVSMFISVECCMKRMCGKADCTGTSY